MTPWLLEKLKHELNAHMVLIMQDYMD